MEKKKKRFITPEGFKGLETLIRYVVRDEVMPIIDDLKNDIHQHQQIVDSYLKKTTGWHEEQIILTARVDKIRDVMINKKMASGRELAV